MQEAHAMPSSVADLSTTLAPTAPVNQEDHPMPSSVADLAALGKLWEDHRPRLLAMLGWRTEGSPVDPEDILQETFVLAGHRWPQFQEQARMTPYAWLYRLALDCLVEAWRKRGRGVLAKERVLDQLSSLLVNVVQASTGPRTAAARAECQEHVRQALAQLKDADREILWMRHGDDLSFKEVAALLDLTENAAAARYVRAARRFRHLWQQLHPSSEVR
jgi:RNA polymerase sigma-70 factor, ECF subfamily